MPGSSPNSGADARETSRLGRREDTCGIGQTGPESPCTGIVVYFRVDDVDSALARAETLGGTRVMEPTETPVSRIAAFADPDGNLIGLLSR